MVFMSAMNLRPAEEGNQLDPYQIGYRTVLTRPLRSTEHESA